MNRYKVFLHGRNFLIKVDGKIQKHGFYTTSYVEAPNQQEAEHFVIDQLRKDFNFAGAVMNEQSDPPMIYVEGIEELETFEGCSVEGTGFTFYPESGDDEASIEDA